MEKVERVNERGQDCWVEGRERERVGVKWKIGGKS